MKIRIQSPSVYKTFISILGIVSLTVFLSSCGSEQGGQTSQDPTDSSQSSSMPQSEAPSAPSDSDSTNPGGIEQLAKLAADNNQTSVSWYESSPDDMIQKTVDAFNDEYPEINIKHVRVTGGVGIAARIVQETSANANSADVATTNAAQIAELEERGLLASLDSDALGITDPDLMVDNYGLITTHAPYAILVNTNKVDEENEPETWLDLADPKWSGLVGSWNNGMGLAELSSELGVDKVEELTKGLVDNKVRLYQSGPAVAQAVASGEVSVAFGIYHSAQPIIESGGPVKAIIVDPTPVTPLLSAVLKDSDNQYAAKLFLAWLDTDAGAKAYEESTLRGNMFLDTEMASKFSQVTLSEYPANETEKMQGLINKFTALLGGEA